MSRMGVHASRGVGVWAQEKDKPPTSKLVEGVLWAVTSECAQCALSLRLAAETVAHKVRPSRIVLTFVAFNLWCRRSLGLRHPSCPFRTVECTSDVKGFHRRPSHRDGINLGLEDLKELLTRR